MSKKSFKTNPAMNFISTETIERVDGTPDSQATATTAIHSTGKKKAPTGYKPNPEYIETKSKRVQILVQPSLYADAKAVCEELGISLNDFIHRSIHEAVYNEHVLGLITRDVRGEE